MERLKERSDHGDLLENLVLGLRRRQHPESLQSTKTPQDLPLLLVQAQLAVGDQRLVPLHFLRRLCILSRSMLQQPIMMGFLWQGEGLRSDSEVGQRSGRALD